MVDDVVAAGVAVLKLGATRLSAGDRVYAESGGPSVLPDPATFLGSADPQQPRLAIKAEFRLVSPARDTRSARWIVMGGD